jgi:molybdopterin molybdotransferase
MRIFTGAPTPLGADVVVMQEKVESNGKSIRIKDDELQKGNNIRAKGSQTKKGDLVAKAGIQLNPAILAFLAGLGIPTIKVYKAPEIFLIITGRELQTPGKSLQDGQIYESNSIGLIAGLKQLQVNSVSKQIADDDEAAITELIKQGLLTSDIVILTGGVSVGDYDFVCSSAQNAGAETIFHKVKQRPGKPLYFGKKDEKLVFGLPGNPASVLTCFYQYVVPSVKKIMGKEIVEETGTYKLASAYEKKPGLSYFLKGKIQGDEVQPLNAQESYQMGSYAIADCLIRLEEERTNYEKAELVQVTRFDV